MSFILYQNIIDGIKGFIREVVDTRIDERAAATPPSDKCSNSAHQRKTVEPMQTLDEDEPSDEEVLNPTVLLVNRKLKAVAKGILVTDSDNNICHGRPVAPNERKVYIQQVIDPRAKPLHPDYEEVLTVGTWTTWYTSQLVFI